MHSNAVSRLVIRHKKQPMENIFHAQFVDFPLKLCLTVNLLFSLSSSFIEYLLNKIRETSYLYTLHNMDHIEKTDAMTEVDFGRVTAMFVKLGCKFKTLSVGNATKLFSHRRVGQEPASDLFGQLSIWAGYKRSGHCSTERRCT